MNTEVINQIKEALTPVAEKIGQGAEYVWGVVVRQQIAEGIGDLLIALFGIVIGIISFRIVKFALKKREEAGIYSDWGVLAGLVGFFGGVEGAECAADHGGGGAEELDGGAVGGGF